MPGLNEQRFENVLLGIRGVRRAWPGRVSIDAALDGKETAEVELAGGLIGHRRPLFMPGEITGGCVRTLILMRSPSPEPTGGVQVQMSTTRTERLALVEEQVGQFQPSHTELDSNRDSKKAKASVQLPRGCARREPGHRCAQG